MLEVCHLSLLVSEISLTGHLLSEISLPSLFELEVSYLCSFLPEDSPSSLPKASH